MGGSGSANRGVSFSLDEDEKVTVIEGVKVHVTVSCHRYEAMLRDVKLMSEANLELASDRGWTAGTRILT